LLDELTDYLPNDTMANHRRLKILLPKRSKAGVNKTL
jgi:hypothetical protein